MTLHLVDTCGSEGEQARRKKLKDQRFHGGIAQRSCANQCGRSRLLLIPFLDYVKGYVTRVRERDGNGSIATMDRHFLIKNSKEN